MPNPYSRSSQETPPRSKGDPTVRRFQLPSGHWRYEYPHPTKPGVWISRQRRHQLKLANAGLCTYCGLRPLATKNHCRSCADKTNARFYRCVANRRKNKKKSKVTLRLDPHAALAADRAKLSTP